MFGQNRFKRIPHDNKLQAWSAADELFEKRYSAEVLGEVLFINDPFGILSLRFASEQTFCINDSATSIEALNQNSKLNNLPRPHVLPKLEECDQYDSVVLWLPKSLNYFSWQLEFASRHLKPLGRVFVLSMVKHVSSGHIDTMNSHFSNVMPGRSEKKARVTELSSPTEQQISKSTEYYVETLDQNVFNLPGCYAGTGLDQGARVFMQQFNRINVRGPVLDMGCGNGVLSLALLKQSPGLNITLVDDNRQALLSAKQNIKRLFGEVDAHYFHSNGLNSVPGRKYELIVCNPPFHQGSTVTEKIAQKLFKDLAQSLSETGECWIIANRHLNYFPSLISHFEHVESVFHSKKFTLYRCNQKED